MQRTTKYRGYTLVRLDPHDQLDPQDIDRLTADWHDEVKRFLQDRFGTDSASYYMDYLAAQHLFDSYRSAANRIESEVTSKFGPGFAIVLDGELKRLSEASDEAYEHRLSDIFGNAGKKSFEHLKAEYRRWASAKLEAVPDVIK